MKFGDFNILHSSFSFDIRYSLFLVRYSSLPYLHSMLLLALAIAPGLAICIFVFYRDAYDKEPALNLFLAFVYGMLTIIPAAILELATRRLTDNSIVGIIFSSFVLVALIEEFFKFLALR